MEDVSPDTIQKAAEGDVAAFEQIYRAFSAFVYTIVLKIVHNRADADDITQEVFTTVYKKLKQFQYRASIKTWMYRIAVNLAINRWHQIKKEADRTADYDPLLVADSVSSDAPAELEKGDKQQLIQRLLDRLNPEQKSCIMLREMQGLSYQEIAETLRININTVRSRLKRAREALLAMQKEEVVPYEM